MIKVIPPNSFDFGMPAADLVRLHSRGIDSAWLEKRASAMVREFENLRPEKGHSLIHLISLGAMEATGMNRNADAFNEKSGELRIPYPKAGVDPIYKMKGGLIEHHPTFLKHAHVFAHHRNNDPSKAIGSIKAAAYNNEMRRGELVIDVEDDHVEWRDELQKLASGGESGFSMSIRVPRDHCLSCGNSARTRAEYCEHLRNHMTEIDKSGHQVGALNDEGTFFDISKVTRPADRIAWALQMRKAASAEGVVGGAELAEMIYGSGEPSAKKMAAARKLAAIEKIVTADATCRPCRGLPVGPLPKKTVETLKQAGLSIAVRALADVGIVPTFEDFAKIAGISCEDEKCPLAIFSKLSEIDLSRLAASRDYDASNAGVPVVVKSALAEVVDTHSMRESYVGRRAALSAIHNQAAPREKAASSVFTSRSEELAKEYAKFQISLATAADDSFIEGMAVLQHMYV